MKKILTTALLAVCALTGMAQAKCTLVVEAKNGSKSEFAFETQPVATFGGQDMTVTWNNGEGTLVFAIDDVASMNILSEESAVRTLEEGRLRFGLLGGILTVEGLAPGATLEIYSLDGGLEIMATCHTATLMADLSALPAGVHVVRAGGKSFKIMK